MSSGGWLAGACALCALAGCSGAGADVATARPNGPGSGEPGSNVTGTAVLGDVLVEGTVSGRFPIENGSECKELGFPITLHLTDAFSPDTLVSETATQISSAACLHVQILAAPANAWARVAYVVICGGGGDAALCGAQATRLCSLNLLLAWADDRARPAPVNDPVLGFEYALPRADESTQTALDRRSLSEVDVLIAESKAILAEHAAGTRRCPNENYDDIQANLAAASPTREGIVAQLSSR